jgi:hypothetical protein
MPQEILDTHQGGIGIEELGGHGVPQLMARHLEACLAGIVLQPLLDTSHRARQPRPWGLAPNKMNCPKLRADALTWPRELRIM